MVGAQFGFFGCKLSDATKLYPISLFAKQTNLVKIYSKVDLDLDFIDVQFIKTIIRVMVNYCPMVQLN